MPDAATKAYTRLDEARTKPLDSAILRRMWQHLRPHRKQVMINMVIAVAIVAMELVPPPLARHIIDVDVFQNRSPTGLARSLAVLLGSILAIWGLWRIFIWRVTSVGERVICELRADIFGHLQRLSMSYFDRTKVGRIIARGTHDLQAMRHTMVWSVPRLVQMTMTLIGAMAMMAWADVRLFAALVFMVPGLWLTNHLFRQRVSEAWRDVREWTSRITANVAENISGIRVVQAFTRENTNLAAFNELQDHAVASHMRAARIFGVYLPTIELIGAFGKGIILLYGGWLVSRGETGIGTLVMFLMCYDMFFEPIRQLGEIHHNALHAMAGGERIYALLDTKPKIVDQPGAAEMPTAQGLVEFDHVTFSYVPGTVVLHDVSFEARAGQTVALVGPTGAGKSSIVNLICRFYEPQSGYIRVDGADIRSVTIDSLRRNIGFVQQENFLFAGTIFDNIRYGRLDASDEEIVEAAKALGCHDVFDAMSDGYQTPVGERGEAISLGQRQLICFTRAMVADPAILILDEATSAVDSETEMRIQQALRQLLSGRTSFVVAHRLSTIRDADLALVIDDGRVVERGTHSELLKLDGQYRRLYEEFVRA